MTTSGSYSYNPNRDQIIRRAARLCAAIASGETPDANTVQDFSDALNAMMKRWQASGLHLWSEQELVLFLQPNQIQYALGATSTDNCTASWVATTLTADAAAAATSVTVDSITGITSGDNFGIVLNDGTIFWTTVNGAPSGHTVTLASDLTSAAESGADVYDYTTKAQRPLRIISGRRYNWSSQIDTPLNPPLSRNDYRELPNKTNTGTVTQFFYDPQLVLGQVYLWPAPPDVTNGVKFTVMRTLQDFLVAGDTGDFPQEWIDPVVFNLALVMAPEYSVPAEQYNMIKEQAQAYYDSVQGFDREPESVYMGVNYNQR